MGKQNLLECRYFFVPVSFCFLDLQEALVFPTLLVDIANLLEHPSWLKGFKRL